MSGPMPAEVLERLRVCHVPVRWVMGNADRCAVTAPADAPYMDRWAHGRLSPGQRAFVAGWEPTVRVGDVLVCHAVPTNDEDKITMLTPPGRLAGFLEGVHARVVVGGHVHHQFTRRSGGTTWVNAGSVGMPYEGRPGAFWLAVRDGHPELRCTPYDLAAAISAIRATGYAEADDYASVLRGEVTPREAAEAFEP